MTHVVIQIVKNHQAPGGPIEIEADLSQQEVNSLNFTLDAAFNEQLIDDYGIDPVNGLADYREVLQRVSKIIGK